MGDSVDLKALQYPRHLHKPNGWRDNPGGDYLRVETPAECEVALRDGWYLQAFEACYDDQPRALVVPPAPVVPPPVLPKGKGK